MPDGAVLWRKTGGEFDNTAHRHNVHVEPAHRPGFMVVALGEDRLKTGKRFQVLEVYLVYFIERRSNGPLDIEVTPGENGAGVEKLLEYRERPAVEVGKRLLNRLCRRVR